MLIENQIVKLRLHGWGTAKVASLVSPTDRSPPGLVGGDDPIGVDS